VGQEVTCTVRFAGRTSDGRALLESQALRFRGAFRLAIPFREVRSVDAADGVLTVEFGNGQACFELGAPAERWAERIRHPRGLLDKLGVSEGARVALIGIADDRFRAQLGERGAVVLPAEGGDLDLLFVAADEPAALEGLYALRGLIRQDGAIWVVSPKGNPSLRDVDVMAAARAAGLVDTKVASFSATHTGLKLVIPRAQRERAASPATMAGVGARRAARSRQRDGA
jgi:hypothetical protein